MTDELRPTGLKAQLHHLLPRHAVFRVRIQIHQLASVPLVHGEFSARWKFKNTQKVKVKGRTRDEDVLQVPEHSQEGSSTSTLGSEEDPIAAELLFAGDEETTSARGQTPWQPLRDHSVTWDHPLSVLVQMSIDRDSHELLPHPFKLTILQRVVTGDPNAPRNPRLGAVDIDLAEYTDSVPASGSPKGVVNRRYLLRDSKTNATLRLSIRVEPVATTPPPFIAPPLPHGEILAGLTSLLTTHSEVFSTRPRALDLYAPPEETTGLTLAYGPRPTESLIEAIFNPTPVCDPRLVSPFTRLVAASAVSPSLSSSASSFISSDHSSASSLAHHNLTPERSPRWWQRNRSRSRSRSRVRSGPQAVAVSA
ncbi:N-terminal C2 in EEIG1 and EHBP1 proteins-domain-containing protein [Mycena amicta]|nr:N-terminal C2 in EEIG1 and EHBP1 proteins-domain-containing protein [Mycena amicta]